MAMVSGEGRNTKRKVVDQGPQQAGETGDEILSVPVRIWRQLNSKEARRASLPKAEYMAVRQAIDQLTSRRCWTPTGNLLMAEGSRG